MPRKQVSPYANDVLIIRSIGQRAIVFGTCEVLGMEAKKVWTPTRMGLTFEYQDCGLLMDAPLAVRVLHDSQQYRSVTHA